MFEGFKYKLPISQNTDIEVIEKRFRDELDAAVQTVENEYGNITI